MEKNKYKYKTIKRSSRSSSNNKTKVKVDEIGEIGGGRGDVARTEEGEAGGGGEWLRSKVSTYTERLLACCCF